MATTKKKPSPAQIAARKAFAERARSGGFKRRKKVATSGAKVKRKMGAPSPAQLAARAKFVAMVRARAKINPSKVTCSTCQGYGWTTSPSTNRRLKCRTCKGKGYVLKNPRRNVAGDSSVKSPTRTSSDVRSPTRTATSTEAQTSGNVTVTGGAGRGATTRVDIHTAAPRGTKAKVGKRGNGRIARKVFGGIKPSPAQRSDLARYLKQVRVKRKATKKKANSRGFSGAAPAWTRSKKAKRNGVLLTNRHMRAACRRLALRDNPGRVRFTEAELAKYAPKIKGLSLVGGSRTSRAMAPARKKKARFKKPAKRALARAFSGSGFMGLGRSRKTVRTNRRTPGHIETSYGKGRKAYKRAKSRGVKGYFSHLDRSIIRGSQVRRGKRNPSPASVFTEFRGKDVRSKSKATFHGSATGAVAQLGHLRELKLVGKKLEFGGNAILCADGRKRLHIGGVRFKATGVEEDMGEVRSVTYRSDKPHIESGVLDYVHKFAEDNGKCPHLIVDPEGYPFLEGGSYKIDADGIIN